MDHRAGADRSPNAAPPPAPPAPPPCAGPHDGPHAQAQPMDRRQIPLDGADRQPHLLAQHGDQAQQPDPEPPLARPPPRPAPVPAASARRSAGSAVPGRRARSPPPGAGATSITSRVRLYRAPAQRGAAAGQWAQACTWRAVGASRCARSRAPGGAVAAARWAAVPACAGFSPGIVGGSSPPRRRRGARAASNSPTRAVKLAQSACAWPASASPRPSRRSRSAIRSRCASTRATRSSRLARYRSSGGSIPAA